MVFFNCLQNTMIWLFILLSMHALEELTLICHPTYHNTDSLIHLRWYIHSTDKHSHKVPEMKCRRPGRRLVWRDNNWTSQCDIAFVQMHPTIRNSLIKRIHASISLVEWVYYAMRRHANDICNNHIRKHAKKMYCTRFAHCKQQHCDKTYDLHTERISINICSVCSLK